MGVITEGRVWCVRGGQTDYRRSLRGRSIPAKKKKKKSMGGANKKGGEGNLKAFVRGCGIPLRGGSRPCGEPGGKG